MAIGVSIPLIYCVLVFGGLIIFSAYYRRNTSLKTVEPYFASHPERDVYTTLVGMTDPPAHDVLLKSALVRRAMADVQRVLRIREDKPALQNLLQKGSVGDDIWTSILAAEQELQAEIEEVVQEANAYVEGWGTVIFQTANEMIANEKIRALYDESLLQRPSKDAKYGIQSVRVDNVKSTNVNNLSDPTSPMTPSGNVLSPTSAGTDSAWSDVDSPKTTPSKSAAKKGKKRR